MSMNTELLQFLDGTLAPEQGSGAIAPPFRLAGAPRSLAQLLQSASAFPARPQFYCCSVRCRAKTLGTPWHADASGSSECRRSCCSRH